MPGRHKYTPIRIRPPEPIRIWLLAYAKETGQPVNAVVTEALADKRAVVENTAPRENHDGHGDAGTAG